MDRGGNFMHVVGVVKRPDHATLEDWISHTIRAAMEGSPLSGGWSPSRSVWVEWGPAQFDECGPEYYYRADDDGFFDLSFSPAQDPIESQDVLALWARTFEEWKKVAFNALRNYIMAIPANEEAIRVALAVQNYLLEDIKKFEAKWEADSEEAKSTRPGWLCWEPVGAFLKPLPQSMILGQAFRVRVQDLDEDHITDEDLSIFKKSASDKPPPKTLLRLKVLNWDKEHIAKEDLTKEDMCVIEPPPKRFRRLRLLNWE